MAVHEGGPARDAVGMTTETELVLELDGIGHDSRKIDSGDTLKRARAQWRRGSAVVGRVGVVAIKAPDVPGRIHQILGGIMQVSSQRHRMHTRFQEFRLNVPDGQMSVVARVAVVFIHRKIE